jgi:hypothetical protein
MGDESTAVIGYWVWMDCWISFFGKFSPVSFPFSFSEGSDVNNKKDWILTQCLWDYSPVCVGALSPVG